MDLSERKLDELDRLLNDPDVPMEAARVWQLSDELSTRREPGWRRGPNSDHLVASAGIGTG